MIADSRQAGLLAPDEQERLADALELGTRPVTDVLLDPAGLVTVDPAVTPRQVEELTVRTGYSRFPVRGPGGAFMSYLHVKDVLELEEPERAVPQHVWRPIQTLRAELPLDDALTVMRRAAAHLAAGQRRVGPGARPGGDGGRAGETGGRGPRPRPPVGRARGGPPLTPAPAADRRGTPPAGPWGQPNGGSLRSRSVGPRPERTSPYACMRSGRRKVARSSWPGVPLQLESRRSR